MNDWRYDYAINETGDWPLIDLHGDVERTVTVEELLDEVSTGDESLAERTEPREAI